jgi:transcriptional regulator with XRE-family HTH domain/plasmid maintenance system antidote protein VapI
MIGERIHAARKAQGLSLRALAERVGLSHEMIRRYERGEATPDGATLIKIADALERNLDYFFRPALLGEIKPAFRLKRKLPARQRAAILAQVQDWLERYLLIESILGLETRFEFPEGFPYPVRQMEDVEDAAVALRNTWQLGLDPIANLTELLEERGLRVGMLSGFEAFDGCTFEVEIGSHRQPVLMYAEGCPGDRQRFSIAHELGHLMLRVESDLDEEKVANRFAGAFLAPKPSVLREITELGNMLTLSELMRLKQKYGMSMQAWIHRLRELQLISKESASRTFKLFRERGWLKTEPGTPYPPESPRRFLSLVLAAYEEEVITTSRASELLNLSYHEFYNRYACLRGGSGVALCRGYKRAVRFKHSPHPNPLRTRGGSHSSPPVHGGG